MTSWYGTQVMAILTAVDAVRGEAVRLGELPQADDRGQEVRDEQQHRQERQQGNANWRVEEEHHEQRGRRVDPEHRLGVGERQRVEGEEALVPGRHLLPGALAQRLHEALVPPRALADEAPQCGRGLFLGDVPVVVDHPDPLAERTHPQADLGVLGEVVLVPAADPQQELAGEEAGVAAERDGPVPRVVVQPAT